MWSATWQQEREVHTYELLDKEEILVADEKGADVRLHYPVRFLLVKKSRLGLVSSYPENSTITTNSSVKRLSTGLWG